MFKRLLSVFSASLLVSQIANAQNQVPPTEIKNNETGYFNTTELAYSKGFLKENTSFYTGLQTINGFRFNQHISAGIGIGVDQYFYKNQNEITDGETYLPVFSDFRIYFGKGKTQPFFSQAVGYMFCVRRLTEFRGSDYYNNIGGILINPAFGVTTPLTEKTSLNFSLGYRFQEVSIKDLPIYLEGYSQTPIIFRSRIDIFSHYISFKAGLTF